MIFFKYLIFFTFLQGFSSAYAKIVDTGAAGKNTRVCLEFGVGGYHRFKPNCSGWTQYAGKKVFMSYNSLGLRDREYSKKAAAGVKRILVLGSSSVEGLVLDEKKSPPRQLEKILRKQKMKVEVINAALEGYFTVLNSIRLSKYLDAYSPDFVLVELPRFASVFTDMLIADDYLIKVNNTPTRLRQDLDVYLPSGVANFLAERGYSNDLLTFNMALGRLLLSWKIKLAASTEQKNKYAFAAADDAFKYMERISKSRNAKFLVFFYDMPITNQYNLPPDWNVAMAKFFDFFTPKIEVSSAEIEKNLDGNLIPKIRLSFVNDEKPVTVSGDYHFNERGATRWAEELSLKIR